MATKFRMQCLKHNSHLKRILFFGHWTSHYIKRRTRRSKPKKKTTQNFSVLLRFLVVSEQIRLVDSGAEEEAKAVIDCVKKGNLLLFSFCVCVCVRAMTIGMVLGLPVARSMLDFQRQNHML